MKITKTNLNSGYSTRKVGPQKNECHYQLALFSTLVELKPKVCLEIGTNTGNTAKIFQHYFDEHCNDGILITCDIKKYVDLSHLKNVKQLIVAHHIHDIEKHHEITKQELLHDHTKSVEKNVELILEQHDSYDFAFIDGDHTRDSFLKDIEICKKVLRSPQYMLIDDTKEPVHECMKVYQNEIKTADQYQCYDFDDWQTFVGCALIRMR